MDIFIWVAQIAAVIFLAYIIIFYAVEKTNVIGNSMDKGLMDQDAIIVDKFTYHFNKPERYDIIIFKQNGREHSYYNVKRIVGLPGERIQIKQDGIYINGELTEDIVDAEAMLNYGLAKEELVLEDNEYFVLGDNRNNSEDSRFASIGNVRREEIIGRAFLRLSPFNFINKLNLKQVTEEVD